MTEMEAELAKLVFGIQTKNINMVQEDLKNHKYLASLPIKSYLSQYPKAPFWEAVLSGSDEIIRLIICNGGDVNKSLYSTPNVCTCRKLKYMQYCAYEKDDSDYHLETIKMAIDHGARLDAITESKTKTALEIAIQEGRLKFAQFLVEHGASLPEFILF